MLESENKLHLIRLRSLPAPLPALQLHRCRCEIRARVPPDQLQQMGVGLPWVIPKREYSRISGNDRILEVVGKAELLPDSKDGAEGKGSGGGHGEDAGEAIHGGRGGGGGGGGLLEGYLGGRGAEADEGLRGGGVVVEREDAGEGANEVEGAAVEAKLRSGG